MVGSCIHLKGYRTCQLASLGPYCSAIGKGTDLIRTSAAFRSPHIVETEADKPSRVDIEVAFAVPVVGGVEGVRGLVHYWLYRGGLPLAVSTHSPRKALLCV